MVTSTISPLDTIKYLIMVRFLFLESNVQVMLGRKLACVYVCVCVCVSVSVCMYMQEDDAAGGPWAVYRSGEVNDGGQG